MGAISAEPQVRWRRELAAAFLVVLAAACAVLLLAPGRLGRAAEPAGVGMPPPGAAALDFLPLDGGTWPVELSTERMGELLGVFLGSLSEQGAGTEAAAGSEPDVDAPIVVTAYLPTEPPIRVLVRERSLAEGMAAAAREVRRRSEGRAEAAGVRLRVDVVREARRMTTDKRAAFAERVLDRPYGLAVLSDGQWNAVVGADVAGWEAADNADLLGVVCRRAGLAPERWQGADLPMWRLETLGFINDAPGSSRPLPSPRGLVAVRAADRANLLRACMSAADYLEGGQGDDGAFSVFSDPASGLGGGCPSLVLHAQAAAAFGMLCELSPAEPYLLACKRAIAYAVQSTDMDPRRPAMAVTSSEETCHPAWELEESAATLEAMCRYRRASDEREVDPWIASLAEFLLFMQQEGGRFELRYDPQSGRAWTPPEAGQAVVAQARGATALALAYRELGRADLLFAAQAAVEPLIKAGPERSAVEARWVMTALAELNGILHDTRYTDLAAAIAARRRACQLAPDEAPADDLVGGTLRPAEGAADFPPRVETTADDLVVFAAACMMGLDGENAAAAERAARYVLAMQFLPENSYYLPQPESALGGFRDQPGANVVRIQTMDAALRGLVMLARLRLRETP